MGGDSGSARLADGATEGCSSARSAQRALPRCVHQATTLPPVWPREHLDAYLKYGYVRNDVGGIGAALTAGVRDRRPRCGPARQALGDSTDAAA